MIQYIASDLDGTLVPSFSPSIDPEIFDIISQLTEKGIRFIAASGRQYHSIRHLFEPVKDKISYITENGSLCIHDGQTIYRGHIERELGLRIIDAGSEYGSCHTLLSCESRTYTDSKSTEFIHHMRNVLHNDIEAVDNLHQIQEPFLKIALCDFNGAERLAPFLKERFSKEIRIATAGGGWVDFLAPDAGKEIALAALLKHFDIRPENGIAFGDQQNDIDMLELAGTSFAMKTAGAGVADHADYVIESVADVLKNILKTGHI